ncbi:3-deoxy-D-manno-octulosonic acid transferase [Flavitalea flava]
MSIIFYHVFLWLYKTGIFLITPWNRKAKLWREGRRDILNRIRAEMAGDPDMGNVKPKGSEDRSITGQGTGKAGKKQVIWMHCASLGEFEQGRPVLESLKQMAPESKVVLTFFSPSGYEIRKDYSGADHIFYLPLDSRRNARKFIDYVGPDLVLWVKYDYWFYYLVELKKRNIPALLISGVFRPDQPFFKWYGRLHRYMLECFRHLFVQTEESKKLLGKLGLSENVSIGGDTRFDRVVEIAEEFEAIPAIGAFCRDFPVIVAGSTWEEDEEELDHFANTHPEYRFIIAPHEIGEARLQEVEKLFRHAVRYSQWTADDPREVLAGRISATDTGSEANVLIIDNIGMLSRLYSYATIAYVGGGFGSDGVHNVLEAAVYGKPVVFGPVIEKYIEVLELVDCGGGLVIDSALEAESVFNRLLGDPEQCRLAGEASRNYVLTKKGATEKVTGYIQAKRLLTN